MRMQNIQQIKAALPPFQSTFQSTLVLKKESNSEFSKYNQINQALSFIPSDDREIWLKIAMAIKSEIGESGFQIWDKWSQLSDKYNEKDCLSTWKSIKSNEIGIGTLYHIAKSYGWQPEKQVQTPQEKAFSIWQSSLPVYNHPYMSQKQIKPYIAKQYKEALVIPLSDIDGNIQNLQFINENGEKRFLKGSKKTGFFCYLEGEGKSNEIIICEGFATGASIHEATGTSVIVAFDSGNLKPVAQKVRKKYPEKTIIIAGDDDKHLNPNVGRKKAIEASQSVDGKVAFPIFAQGEGKDFNDLACTEDLKAVAKSIEAAQSSVRIAQETVKTPVETTNEEIENNFWYEIHDRKTGKIKLQISLTKLYSFLKLQGFCHIKYENNIILVRIQNNICEQATNADMQRVASLFINDLPLQISSNFDRFFLQETFARGINSYVSDNLNNISFVPVETPVFVSDTKEKSFAFFTNGFSETSKYGILMKKYEDLQGVIWRSQIIDHEFTLTDYNGFSFAEFCKCACTDRKIGTPDINRHQALLETIGYMLHNYRTRYENKAVILSEASLDDDPQGRTGKGLLLEAIGKMRKKITIDGRNFSFDSVFAFQSVDFDSQIIFFDDVPKRFDFRRLFSAITEGISYEKKGKDRVNLPPEKSPKIVISTNYAITGSTESDKGRRIDMELLCYFNKTHTPKVEFGETFFSSNWNNKKWSQFYSFMLNCVQQWLSKKKITEYQSETVDLKKIITETSRDFVEYADSQIPINETIPFAKIYEDFVSLNQLMEKDCSPKRFGIFLEKWTKFKQLQLVKQDRKNNGKTTRYVTFSEPLATTKYCEFADTN